MGVPVFFKWLCMRNPKILRDALECSEQDLDSSNPYVDNFYVDMNGLIHPSCNPRGQAIREPKNFEQQIENIEMYLDKIMNIVRPRRLLYLAIDGVAPRAKMNQQRSRRFRAAMEGVETQAKKQELLEQYKQKQIDTSEIETYVNKISFDSNVITPGTSFLCNVAKALRNYIHRRTSTHRHWKHLTVVFSDAGCPGQGEHKIMEFVRQQRASTAYDPNQTHCIYGADADLIMLGLATHQPRFYIIREVVITAQEKWCSNCGKRGHYFTDCRPAQSIEDEQVVQNCLNAEAINVKFQFLNLKLVRQYLHLTFMRASVPFGYNLERILDDFVFLCFFVGNDFLPHVPILSIREGGIDILMRVYEYCLGIMPDYITKSGSVNFPSLKCFINEMKIYEQDVVEEIITKQYQAKQREQNQKFYKGGQNKEEQALIDWSNPLQSFKEEVKKLTSSQNNLENYSVFSHTLYNYKEKYYREKLKIHPKDFIRTKHQISQAYLQALNWICHYYYKGVASWSWYYPFHYAPFFTDIQVEPIKDFNVGHPFKPFEQLMAVMPPKTSHVLPQNLRPLMLNPLSPLADYFPSQFQIDLIGKKFTWLGQVLLPFIDDNRLLKAMGQYHDFLTAQQKQRNQLGVDLLFFNKFSSLGRKIDFKGQVQAGIQVNYGEFKVQGKLKLLKVEGDVSEWQFDQPSGRKHEVKLKEGIQFSMLEQLNDDFVRKLDKKSYGGERFVRIIERSLGNRIHQLHRNSSQQSRDNKSRDRQRSRSRDKGKNRDDNPRRQSNDDRRGRDNGNQRVRNEQRGQRGQDRNRDNRRDRKPNRQS